jgi:hypothetical protein
LDGLEKAARKLAGPIPEAAAATPKGKRGRRGYPLKALKFAQKLRTKHRMMKAAEIRGECLRAGFDKNELPPDVESFRRWLNRPRANRAN